MVFQKNEGQEQDEILQNRITSYLLAAVHRRRAQYIDEEVKAQSQFGQLEHTYKNRFGSRFLAPKTLFADRSKVLDPQ